MLRDVKTAEESIMRYARPGEPVRAPLSEAVGRVLREPVYADRDFPPFDRVSMDGIAIDYKAWLAGRRQFKIENLQLAGEPRKKLQNPACCIEIMTGAILSENTNTVIRYEDLEIAGTPGDRTVRVLNDVRQGQNVHPKGKDRKQGDCLITAGTPLSPAEIAIAASVGKSELLVSELPLCAVISTGDELAPVESQPAPHQIRQSNGHMLQAALYEMRLPSEHFHLPDDKPTIERRLAEILAGFNVILLSGGVSKGRADYVPEVMEKLGVRALFHNVAQRPGKPFWFGAGPEGQVVFAFPGNPVSTFVGFYRYFKPFLLKALAVDPALFAIQQKAVLAGDFSFKPALTYFLTVKTEFSESGFLKAYPRPGKGSGDLANLVDCDGMLELPAEQTEFRSGEIFDYIPFRKILF